MKSWYEKRLEQWEIESNCHKLGIPTEEESIKNFETFNDKVELEMILGKEVHRQFPMTEEEAYLDEAESNIDNLKPSTNPIIIKDRYEVSGSDMCWISPIYNKDGKQVGNLELTSEQKDSYDKMMRHG